MATFNNNIICLIPFKHYKLKTYKKDTKSLNNHYHQFNR